MVVYRVKQGTRFSAKDRGVEDFRHIMLDSEANVRRDTAFRHWHYMVINADLATFVARLQLGHFAFAVCGVVCFIFLYAQVTWVEEVSTGIVLRDHYGR